MKYPCPCCKYKTYNVPPKNDVGYICSVCFWENDVFISNDNQPSDCNHGLTLNQARENFKNFGACEKSMLKYVRWPLQEKF